MIASDDSTGLDVVAEKQHVTSGAQLLVTRYSLSLPIKTVAGQNAREHWRERARRVAKERSMARGAVLQHLPAKRLLPCTVTMTRVSAGELDDDNLSGAFKAIRDGVADALGIDDRDKRVRWKYGQAKCGRGEYGVIIQFEVGGN